MALSISLFPFASRYLFRARALKSGTQRTARILRLQQSSQHDKRQISLRYIHVSSMSSLSHPINALHNYKNYTMDFRSTMHDHDRRRFRTRLLLRRTSFRRQSPPPPYSSDSEPEYQDDPTYTTTTSSNPSPRSDGPLQNSVNAHDTTLSQSDTTSVPIPVETPRTDFPVLPEGEVVVTVGAVKITGTPIAVSRVVASLSKVDPTLVGVNKQAVAVGDETLKATMRKMIEKIGDHGSWYLIWLAGIWLGAGIWFPALAILGREIVFWLSERSDLDREVWFRLFSYALGCGLILLGIPRW